MNIFIIIFGFLGATSIALGAFVAHGLKSLLTPELIQTYQTAVLYQSLTTLILGINLIILTLNKIKMLQYSAVGFICGIFLFSGSLYLLVLTGIRQFGIITPIGGVMLIISWILLTIGWLRSNQYSMSEN